MKCPRCGVELGEIEDEEGNPIFIFCPKCGADLWESSETDLQECCMKDSTELKNTQQWCPEVETVVVLSIRGDVKGNLIEGEVLDCNRYECKITKAKNFCWIRRRILTSLW